MSKHERNDGGVKENEYNEERGMIRLGSMVLWGTRSGRRHVSQSIEPPRGKANPVATPPPHSNPPLPTQNPPPPTTSILQHYVNNGYCCYSVVP
jgi:hypothetical protein